MKCQTCATVIPPEWKSAISSNLCPACGDKIYSDETAELISGLAEALSKMPNDVLGVVGWLFSNYEVRKIGDAKPVDKFYGEKPKDRQQTKIEENSADKFLKRTGSYNSVKKLQEKIQGKGKLSEMAKTIVDIEAEAEMNEQDEVQMDDDAGLEEGGLVQGTSLIDPRVQELNEDELSELTNRVQQAPQTSSEEQVLNELKKQRFNRLKAQNAVQTGGPGAFRRS